MPLIRMKHAQHGFHHVYSDDEAKVHEQLGWTREAQDEPKAERKKPGPKPKQKAD